MRPEMSSASWNSVSDVDFVPENTTKVRVCFRRSIGFRPTLFVIVDESLNVVLQNVEHGKNFAEGALYLKTLDIIECRKDSWWNYVLQQSGLDYLKMHWLTSSSSSSRVFEMSCCTIARVRWQTMERVGFGSPWQMTSSRSDSRNFDSFFCSNDRSSVIFR